MPSPFSSGVPRDTIGKRSPSLLVRDDKRMKMYDGKALGPAAPRVFFLGLP